jgi:hypothetical protein
MIQSGLRRAVAASAAQVGDGDWIITSLPAGRRSGIESQMLQDTLIQDRMYVLKGRKVFIWRVPLRLTQGRERGRTAPRQIKKVFSVSSVPLW